MSEEAVALQGPNPFNYTRPAEEELFVGCEEQQQCAVNLLCESVPKICRVIGGPKIGKTSFIRHLSQFSDLHLCRIGCRDFDAAGNPMEWLGRQITKASIDLLDRALAEIQDREIHLVQGRLVAIGEAIGQSLSSFREEVHQRSESGQPILRGIIGRFESSLQSAERALETVLALYPGEIGKEIRARRQFKDASEAIKQGMEILGSDYLETRKKVEEMLANLDGTLRCLQDLWGESKSVAIAKGRLSSYRSAISVQDFQLLGKDLRELHENIKLVLAFDDFDQLVEKGKLDADQFTEVLRGLRSLRGSSDLKIRLLESFSGKPEKILDRKFPQQPEALQIEIEAWTRDSEGIELSAMTLAEVKALIDNVGSPFPQYVARELFRETGGHPFLVQTLCHFAFEERIEIGQDPSVSNIVVWIEVMRRVRESEHVKRFKRSFVDFSEEAQELIRQATQKGGELGRLPNEITWRGGVFKHQTRKAKTRAIVDSLMQEPSTRGLVFREAEEDEIESAMPYLFRIDGERPGTEYAIASRFIWRLLGEEGVFRRRRPVLHLPRLDLFQLPFVVFLTYMVPWLIFRWFGIDTLWSLPFPFLVLLYALCLWVIDRVRSVQRET